MSSFVKYHHLFGLPDDSHEEELRFTSGDEEEVPFVAWVSPTYIDSSIRFDSDNAWAFDVLRIDGNLLKPRLWGSDWLGPKEGPGSEPTNLRRAAYVGTGSRVTVRLRVRGPDLGVGGYGCALPLDQLDKRVRTSRRQLRAYPGHEEDVEEITFDSSARVLIWTAISAIIPHKTFDRNNAVAIDIPLIDGTPTSKIWYGGDHLGEQGDTANLHRGVWKGDATTITVRLRTFGPDVAVAGYACVLYYP